VGGEHIRREPLEDRKRRLAGLLRLPHEGIAVNEHFRGDSVVIYKHAFALGCEGIVSKRLGSPHRAGRSAHRLKIKNPDAPAVRRLEEEDWNGRSGAEGENGSVPLHRQLLPQPVCRRIVQSSG
jgi:ATP-dependent DNA ligase